MRRPEVGLTITGVTMITSSLCPRWKACERKSAPRTGIVPSPGVREAFCVRGVRHQPGDGEALAAGEITVVSARRVRSDGTVVLWAKFSSLTSVPTVRLIRLPSTTVGVKLNRCRSS